MEGDGEVSALVCDNGSGMVKGAFLPLPSPLLFDNAYSFVPPPRLSPPRRLWAIASSPIITDHMCVADQQDKLAGGGAKPRGALRDPKVENNVNRGGRLATKSEKGELLINVSGNDCIKDCGVVRDQQMRKYIHERQAHSVLLKLTLNPETQPALPAMMRRAPSSPQLSAARAIRA